MNTALKFATLASGLRMGYVEAGPPDGIPVLLLHGFPEFHWSFRLQWPALAAAGYRVIAPDQRGYNLSGKAAPYDRDTLARDIAQLQDVLGIERSHIVGHDWGGVMTYSFAHRYPARVNKLVILNVPHINAYLDSIRAGNRDQLRKSWYIYYFQLPWLPEFAIRRKNYAFAERILAGMKNTSAVDVAKYKAAYAQPGALSAMIGWYRALFRWMLLKRFNPPAEPVAAPVRVIWGERDLALDKHTNDTLKRYAPNAHIIYLPEASHWVQLDAPDEVNRLILEFLPNE